MMEDMVMHGSEPREILKMVQEKKYPAIMSYLSKGKWHVAKMLLTEVGANRFVIEASPREKPYPININIGQTIGLSIKYDYGKFVLESTVVDLRAGDSRQSSGKIDVLIPQNIQVVSRRSYFRVTIPAELNVDVTFWHRKCSNCTQMSKPENNYHGKMVDISAGGSQVVVSKQDKFDFNRGQFIGVKFTPTPYDKAIVFTAQIRNILPTADDTHLCLGLQIVGLEASGKGMQTLRRICNVVENYHQINENSIKQHDFDTTDQII